MANNLDLFSRVLNLNLGLCFIVELLGFLTTKDDRNRLIALLTLVSGSMVIASGLIELSPWHRGLGVGLPSLQNLHLLTHPHLWYPLF